MSSFTFKEGQPINFEPRLGGGTKQAFTVASVDKDGQATALIMEKDAPTPSEALNIASKLTGATSAVLGKKDGTIELTHGHRPTSPHYTESRNFG